MTKATKSKAKNADAELTKAALFSLTGSFNPTEFRFHQTNLQNAEALLALGKGVAPFRALPSVLVRKNQGYVGTNSVHLSDNEQTDPKKVDALLTTNPGQRDYAALDADNDVLVIIGTVKFVPLYAAPTLCDNPAYRAYHAEFVQSYLADGNLPVLMRRYITNFVDGSLLWRNRYGYSLRTVVTLRIPGSSEHFIFEQPEGPGFDALVAAASAKAVGAKNYFGLEVALVVELGHNSEVFPSQPFIEADKKKELRGVDKDHSYGRMLATSLDPNRADQIILHPQKVGNAIRRVDYGYADSVEEPIAIELYGTDAHQRVAHRYGKGNSYFELIAQKRYADMTEEERHYVMAVFIKGGPLGFSQDKKGKGAAGAESEE